jgi:hypothetical protein
MRRYAPWQTRCAKSSADRSQRRLAGRNPASSERVGLAVVGLLSDRDAGSTAGKIDEALKAPPRSFRLHGVLVGLLCKRVSKSSFERDSTAVEPRSP